jgi:serine/threonine protein phosphatase 1
MRTLAIGDIHGCQTALTRLLREVGPRPEDRLVFLGDYIDRGPDSRGVIDHLLVLAGTCTTVFLRGNHEVMILDARDESLKSNLWENYGGLEAVASYGCTLVQDWVSAVPESHWRFFEHTARFFETDKCIFVHACLDAGLDMADQPDWLLFWELFDRIQPHKSGKRIICGHTRQSSGLINDLGFATCIDTGAAVGGWLTCLDADSGRFWQANENSQVRTGSLQR